MEHLVKLLRDSYDLQEEKGEESAYWHLQQLRSEIKQLTLTEQLVCDDNELDCPYEFTSRCTMGRCDCKPKAN